MKNIITKLDQSKIEKFKIELKEISRYLNSTDIDYTSKKYITQSQKHVKLSAIIDIYNRYKSNIEEIEDINTLIENSKNDSSIEDFINEKKIILNNLEKSYKDLTNLLYPNLNSENSCTSIILEIRAGVGGDEASLFVMDLYKMYYKFSEKHNLKFKIISSSKIGLDGFKDIYINIKGNGVYNLLKLEMGVHRVQRVPITESNGRVHTSTATVAVLPEVKEEELTINPSDLKIDTFRSQGAGGQHVNTTDSAIRITHIPTNIVAQCQDEKSQHKNKAKAMMVLRTRIKNKLDEEQIDKISEDRKNQIGSAKRSEKIRTYNFPQNRFTDHRFNININNLHDILNGNIDLVNKKIEISKNNSL